MGAGTASARPADGDWGARKPDLAAGRGSGEPQIPKDLRDEIIGGLLQNGLSVFSGHWRRRENPHGVVAAAALDATSVALADLASFKGGRNSSRNPNEGNDREENGRGTNEHVIDSTKELEFLLVNDAHTHFLYLEFALLCPSWGVTRPRKGARLDVR